MYLHTPLHVYYPFWTSPGWRIVARSTKEEALATRHRLLDAAELLFQQHGVSRTSLQHIAVQAGTTRGAIYWHFKDKADLFNAMMERVTLPLERSLEPQTGAAADALAGLRAGVLHALQQLSTDGQLRRVFEVATQKVEYIDELHAVRDRHLAVRNACVVDIAQALRLAARQRGHRMKLPAAQAAHGLHALVDGLIRNWLLDPREFDLPVVGAQVLDIYLAGLGLRQAPSAAKTD